MPGSFRGYMDLNGKMIFLNGFLRGCRSICSENTAICAKQSFISVSKKAVVFALMICLCAALSFAANSGKTGRAAVVKILRLSDEVYMLSTSGAEIGVGNIGLSIGRDGILMIDTQLASLAPKIKAAIKKISSGKVRFVINTHWHADHIGGNEIFGKEATIIAQKNVRLYLSGNDPAAMPRFALPAINYEDSLSLNFNDDEIKIIHFPNAHTGGDSVVFFTKANVVHLGDLYKGHRFPGVDLSHGGSVTGLADDIGKIIDMMPENVKIIPGHGEAASLNDLRIYQRMLIETCAFVAEEIARHKTLEQIKKDGLPAEFDSWNNGLTNSDLWIEQIYQSLQRK